MKDEKDAGFATVEESEIGKMAVKQSKHILISWKFFLWDIGSTLLVKRGLKTMKNEPQRSPGKSCLSNQKEINQKNKEEKLCQIKLF